MDIRYSANQRDVKRYTTQELRDEFLIQNLYAANEVVAVYSHVDRMVTLGCMPTTETVSIDKGIDCWKNSEPTIFWSAARLVFSISAEAAGLWLTDRNSRWDIRTACTSQKEQRKYIFPATMRLHRLSSTW